jgi:hypothetical protein
LDTWHFLIFPFYIIIIIIIFSFAVHSHPFHLPPPSTYRFRPVSSRFLLISFSIFFTTVLSCPLPVPSFYFSFIFCSSVIISLPAPSTTWPAQLYVQGKKKEGKVIPVLAYLLIELSPSWEAANCAAAQERPRILWNPKIHHRVHKQGAATSIGEVATCTTASMCSVETNTRRSTNHRAWTIQFEFPQLNGVDGRAWEKWWVWILI